MFIDTRRRGLFGGRPGEVGGLPGGLGYGLEGGVVSGVEAPLPGALKGDVDSGVEGALTGGLGIGSRIIDASFPGVRSVLSSLADIMAIIACVHRARPWYVSLVILGWWSVLGAGVSTAEGHEVVAVFATMSTGIFTASEIRR